MELPEIFLVRGLPASGKTAVATIISPYYNVCADDYFDNLAYDQGATYQEVFDRRLLGEAHEACRLQVRKWMSMGLGPIAVHNTFTREWEMKDYFRLARKYGYRVHVITVEKHHDGVNDHPVPEKHVRRMASRWEWMDRRLA